MMRVTRREQMLLTATLLPLLLVGLCAATEYYVKSTILQETSCPRESCYTLDELAANYVYASATDVLTDNVTVIFLNGIHELKGSVFVREVNDFTLLGAGGANAESNVEINCKGLYSLVFDGIINLTITGITFSQCGSQFQHNGIYQHLDLPLDVPRVNALTFSDVFNLRLIWVVIQNSIDNGILALNVLGTSVIDHSLFQNLEFNAMRLQNDYNNDNTFPVRHIYLRYKNCNQIQYSSLRCSNETKSLLHAVKSHKLHFHNCVLRDGRRGSMKIALYHNGYDVELDLMNLTVLNGGGVSERGDICIDIGHEANYLVTLRDSYIGHSEGAAISVTSRHTESYVSQLIHITNIVIHKCAAGIYIRSLATPIVKTLTQIMIKNCILMDISGTNDELRGQGLRIVGVSAEHPQFSVVLRNVSFLNNTLPVKGVVYLNLVKEIELIDCRFFGNQGTSIILYKSTLNVSGTLSFVNNTAYQGGAMVFHKESYMSVSLENNTQILFTNNYAEHVGGAIFADETDDKVCFLQIATHNSKCSDLKNNYHLTFVFSNNTANNGGDAVYGGFLYRCIASHCQDEYDFSEPTVGAYIFIINSWNLVQYDTGHHSNLSLITSAPSRVCLCEDGQPDCLTVLANETHYPGETFTISAVVVGQGFGTIDGTVYAQFTNKDTPRLEELQQSQQVNHSSCTKLKYTVFSSNKKEMLVLSVTPTVSETGWDYIDYYQGYVPTDITTSTDQFEMYQYRDTINEFMEFEVTIKISLLPCPLGFMLSDQPAKCVCHTTLQLHNITCNIDNQTVHRGGTVWVNASFAGNKSNGVIVHHHCPYGYCTFEELDIRLDSPDTQCNFNHSGILCGGCRPGLSLMLGTSQCLRCSNKYIALLIPFAIAGIVLVAFIKLLNLTVSEGTLNGLIFYANIIGVNQATFFPSTSKHCPVLTVFIAWLNLDLGIETCFIDGLNGYWKTWLQFVFPAYIWIITAVMIVASHYSSTGARIFGNNSVRVLATLFLLSYTKLLHTFIVVISFTFLDHPDDSRTAVWLYDGNVQYLSPAHVPLFLVALTVFFTLWLPCTLVLLLMQCIRRKTHHRALRFFARKKPLFDAYLGPFKDKHCYWVGVMLLMRALLLVIHAVNPNNAPKVNLLVIGIVTFGLVAYTATVEKVYKKWYLTFLENSFLFNLGVLALGTSYTSGKGKSQTAVVHTLVGIAFLQFIGIIIFHACQSIKKSRTWRNRSQRLFRNREQNDMENVCLNHEQDEGSHGMERGGQARQLKLSFNELREPVLEYADDDT